MFTRKQYLAQECTHEEYYTQFVTDGTQRLVVQVFGLEQLRAALATDAALNSIPLAKWDALAPWVSCHAALREAGDYLTLAGAVCILKTAARLAVASPEEEGS